MDMTMTTESTTAESTSDLFLPDLQIKGFRGFKDLHIPQLGRVTLLAGKNGIGKTSVLEAVQVYASRGSASTIFDILNKREEYLPSINDSNGADSSLVAMLDHKALFYNWSVSRESKIVIGPTNEEASEQLVIGLEPPGEEERQLFDMGLFDGMSDYFLLKSKLEGNERILPWVYSQELGVVACLGTHWDQGLRFSKNGNGGQLAQECRILGPDFIGNNDTANFWSQAVMNGAEKRVIEAVEMVLSRKVDLLTMIDATLNERNRQRVVVRLEGQEKAVSLKSLGDGALRLFSVAAAFASIKDGFVLIDEVENGIHHTAQYDFWKMVFNVASENNLQVFAATHSFDCVRGFTEAATESETEDGILIRLDHSRVDPEKIRAVDYPEGTLRAAVEQRIEVR